MLTAPTRVSCPPRRHARRAQALLAVDGNSNGPTRRPPSPRSLSFSWARRPAPTPSAPTGLVNLAFLGAIALTEGMLTLGVGLL